MTLRLVHPAKPGQATRPPKGRRRHPTCVSLTAYEAQHLRAALRNLRHAYGSWSCLAEVMDMSAISLKFALHKPPGPGLALRAARAAGMSVEAILTGKLSSAGRCPTCGSRVGDRAERRVS